MLRLKKLIMLVLAAVIVSFGVAGCKQKAEHPKRHRTEAPSAEHPTDGNKPAEHPEHPK